MVKLNLTVEDKAAILEEPHAGIGAAPLRFAVSAKAVTSLAGSTLRSRATAEDGHMCAVMSQALGVRNSVIRFIPLNSELHAPNYPGCETMGLKVKSR